MISFSIRTNEIRRFGITAFVIFGCLFALGVWTRKSAPIYLFGFLSIVGFALVLFPVYLSPVYGAWLRIAHLLGTIVTALILTVAYYLVITPSGLIKRLIGGAPIPMKPNKEASSYWVIRSESLQPRERFIKRY